MQFQVQSFFKKNDSQHPDTSIHNNKKLFGLALAALGVVYGDIGTSPLYAINEIFLGHGQTPVTPDNVVGAISLVIWVLTIVVSIKYLCFVLRADNDGEGGVFALYSKIVKYKKLGTLILTVMLMLAAGLLLGEGIITPAISVLSAVEGLNIATPAFSNWVVPITVIILTGLFSIQKKGTSKVGIVFGPIVIVWFTSIAYFGLLQIIQNQGILQAINPIHAITFLLSGSFHQILLVLGAAVLAITGGEALFADMGHFGKAPIRLGWFSVVYPALLLNYLGQGAFVLGNPQIPGGNIFYGMIPANFLIPMVIVATLATIIASQALISGAFSLAQQAISFGLFPRLKIRHTHHEHEGQIYVGFVNWGIFVGCILLVLTFKTSTALAAAYGLSVSGVMLTTSLSMMAISILTWKWNKLLAFALWGALAFIDLSFLTANSLKFFEGGFVPLTIGVVLFITMSAWQWGRTITDKAYSKQESMTVKELIELKKRQTYLSERSVILMTPKSIKSAEENTPALMQLYWDRYRVIPKHLVFLDIIHERVPYIYEDRCFVRYFQNDPEFGSITDVQIRFGFMEEPDVEQVLKELAHDKQINFAENTADWSVEVTKERLWPSKTLHIFWKLILSLFNLLRKIAEPSYYYYGLGQGGVNLSLEVLPIKVSGGRTSPKKPKNMSIKFV